MVRATIMMLRFLGFFSELGESQYYSTDMRDSIRSDAGENEAELVSYLRDGYVVLDVMETSTDVLGNDEVIIGAPSLMTDGTWLWRLDLAHYVERYHLILPADFLVHVKDGGYRVPALGEEDLEQLGPEVLSYF